MNIIVTALADMGGQIFEMELKYPRGKKHITPELQPEVMKINASYVNKILGLDLKENDIKKYLARMGYDYSNDKALVPVYRVDVLHPADLVEDIAIAYGYDKFKEEIPEVATIAQEDKFEIFKRKIAEVLVGLGLIETNTYNLTNKDILSIAANVAVSYVVSNNLRKIQAFSGR